jgi:hypothetical protein
MALNYHSWCEINSNCFFFFFSHFIHSFIYLYFCSCTHFTNVHWNFGKINYYSAHWVI